MLFRFFVSRKPTDIINYYNKLFCVFDGTRFSYNVDLDLPRIFEFAFYLLGYIFGEIHCLNVVYLFGFNDYADFSACLNGVTFIYAVKT